MTIDKTNKSIFIKYFFKKKTILLLYPYRLLHIQIGDSKQNGTFIYYYLANQTLISLALTRLG